MQLKEISHQIATDLEILKVDPDGASDRETPGLNRDDLLKTVLSRQEHRVINSLISNYRLAI